MEPKQCDLDGDGYVTISDIFLFRVHFGTMPGNEHYDERADFNGDKRIDVEDARILKAAYDAEFSGLMNGTSDYTPPEEEEAKEGADG